MATIIINAITHRAACLDSLDEGDEKAYDATIDRYLSNIGEQIRAAGFGFEVDQMGQGTASYRVVAEADEADYNAAHEYMQYEVDDFWAAY